MSEKARAFWLHYNKPESHRRGVPIATIHYMGKCHLVEHVVIEGVRVESRLRKSQPRWVLAGKAVVTVEGGVAHITSPLQS